MKDQEICRLYREAKYPNEQVQIFADLESTNKYEIIRILIANNEELKQPTVRHLHKRLDSLDRLISKKEQRRRDLVKADGHEAPARLNREIANAEREYQTVTELLSKIEKKKKEGR